MATPKFVFLDGKILPYADAKVGVMTHGLNYGTGIFRRYPGILERQRKTDVYIPPARSL